jgi:hypothetical protein
MASRRKNPSSRRREPDWATWPDEELLKLRPCDLGVRIEGSVLEERIARLHEELERKGVRFRPHYWLAGDWFSPDGVPGIAMPFYMAHPRLMKLEASQVLEAEGGGAEECMKILRHEMGHAIGSAHRLHRRRGWRDAFGRFSEPYQGTYSPKPHSRSFVVHLDMWYAQSHPAEDFAETFAVWLTPGSAWRRRHAGWPALRKLEYIDRVMTEIGAAPAPVRTRRTVEGLRTLKMTLGDYYKAKREKYGMDHPDVYERDLRRLFSDSPEHARKRSAASFLSRVRPDLRRLVAYWTGQRRYTIDLVLADMIDHCKELGLRLGRPEPEVMANATVLLTVLTMNHVHDGHHRLVR